MLQIAITGEKGGVGKSTITVLLSQWLKYKGYKINILDADPNKSVTTWINKCKNKGFNICSSTPTISIIDTAGGAGSSAIKYVHDANIIILPFQPHIVDLEVITSWFFQCDQSLQERIIFMPNRKGNANEKTQKQGLATIEKVIQEEKKGILLEGFKNRIAVYGAILNGYSDNFFNSLKDKKAIEECDKNFSIIEHYLNKKTN